MVARGPGRLHCFEARGPAGATVLQRLGGATRTGRTAAAIRQLGLDAAAIMEELSELYDRGELNLVRSPDKILLFRTRDLRDQEVQSIVDGIAEKVEKRLAGFDAFVKLIEARADPCSILQERFGAKPSEKNVCSE